MMLLQWISLIASFATLFTCSECDVTNEELVELGNALWREDRRISHVQYQIQGKVESRQSRTDTDEAPNKLFSTLPDGIFEGRETILNYKRLFDNYERNVNTKEDYTMEEDAEVDDFLTSVLDTKVMQVAWDFLVNEGFSSSNPDEFFAQLKEIWFTPFKRGGKTNSSSGFEHVFIGEVKKSTTAGFHNWIRFYNEESEGRINYAGYYDLKNFGSGSVLTTKFFWDPYLKPKGSFFIRTTPEFEMALYTSCFFARPNKLCKTQVNGTAIKIQTVQRNLGDKVVVNTAYPNTLA